MAAIGQSAPEAEINIVPLIDVVLVLLIIFMVMTPLMVGEMDVEVPGKAEVETAAQVPQDQLVLSMEPNWDIKVNREPVPLTDLSTRLQGIFAARAKGDKVIFFDAADDVKYEDAVTVLDAIRGSGAEKIGLVEEHIISPPPQ